MTEFRWLGALTLLVATLSACSVAELEPTSTTTANPTTTASAITTTTGAHQTTSPGESVDPETGLGSKLAMAQPDLPRSSAGTTLTPVVIEVEGLQPQSESGLIDDYLDRGVTGGGPTDAGATTYEQLSALTITDIESFWGTHWEQQYPTILYSPPTSFTWYDSSTGSIPPNECTHEIDDPRELAVNAFYCYLDRTISYDLVLAARNYTDAGDFAIVGVIAHEWGHHLQGLIQGQPSAADVPTFSVESELQADCFAGVYGRNSGASGAFPVNQADINEAASTFYQIGGEPRYGWFEPGFHGSQLERFEAFRFGFDSGEARSCDTYATYMAEVTVATGPYAIGHLSDADLTFPTPGTFQLRGSGYGDVTIQGRSFELGQLEATEESVHGAFLEVLRLWAPGDATPAGVDLAAITAVEDFTQSTQSAGIPGVTLGYAYEQQLADGRPVHGYVIVHLLQTGDSLVVDVFANGAAPSTGSGWEPVALNTLRALSSFQAPGARG